jgi:hypothetical protein
MIKTMIMKHCLFISMMAVCCGSIALVEAEAGAQAQLPGFERPTAAAVFKGDGAALEILSKSWDPTAHGDGAMDASGAEGADATFEMMFKAESCELQGIFAQSYELHTAFDGENAKKDQQNGSASTGGAIHPPFHGRGIMITESGQFNVWSRDGEGVWKGVDLGPCDTKTWHHIAFVQNGNAVHGVLDGRPSHEVIMDGNQGGRYLGVFTVGRFTNGPADGDFSAQGRLSQVRFWNAALTTKQIKCSGVPTKDTKAILFSWSAPSANYSRDGKFVLKESGTLDYDRTIPDKLMGSDKSCPVSAPSQQVQASMRFREQRGKTMLRSGKHMQQKRSASTSLEPNAAAAAKAAAKTSGGKDALHKLSEMHGKNKALTKENKELRAKLGMKPHGHDDGIKAGACPHGCSGNGKCDMSTYTCFCHMGYIGAGCDKSWYQGYALSFSGPAEKEYVEVPACGASNSLTLEAWLKMDAVDGWQSLRSDVKDKVGAVSWSVRDGHVGLEVVGNNPREVWFDHVLDTKWHHVAVTYSRKHANRTGTGSATLYIDGQVKQTLKYMSSGKVIMGTSLIGGFESPQGMSRFLSGSIDEFRVWSRALSMSVLKGRGHAKGGRVRGDEPHILVYYRFDEGTGHIVADMSGDTVDIADGSAPGSVFVELEERDTVASMRLDGLLGGAKGTGGKPRFIKSEAPFAACNLKCGHGECVVTLVEGDQVGGCVCEYGWGGVDCSIALCPGTPPCSAHGACVVDEVGKMRGWTKPKVEQFLDATARVKHELNSKLAMQQDTAQKLNEAKAAILAAEESAAKSKVHMCMCVHGWGGPSCNELVCPDDCSNRGQCNNGTCICNDGWTGTNCAVPKCPGDGTCSGRGECVNGTCACDAGYAGEDCGKISHCPRDCGGPSNGKCVNGVCICMPAYTGDDCSWTSSCYNFCSGRGKCVDDKCECDPMFMGIDCSEPRCPGDCSGHGDCIRGVCICELGWEGDGCAKSSMWPMRCSHQRHGFTSTSSCKRGLAAWKVAPRPGSQVVQINFDASGAARSQERLG